MSSLEKKHREIISPRFTDIITLCILPVRIERKVNADKLLCWCIVTTREPNARTKNRFTALRSNAVFHVTLFISLLHILAPFCACSFYIIYNSCQSVSAFYWIPFPLFLSLITSPRKSVTSCITAAAATLQRFSYTHTPCRLRHHLARRENTGELSNFSLFVHGKGFSEDHYTQVSDLPST